MKKSRIVLQCLVLAAAIAAFGVYWMFSNARSDTTGPEITVDDSLLELSVQDPSSMLLQGITAYDQRDGDVTASILVESVYGISADHVTTVTYAAFDRAGNVTKAQRNIRYTDYTPPKFTLDCSLAVPRDSTINILDCIGAEDVLDGDIRRRVRTTIVSDTGTLRDEGVHQVQLRVTNSLGDMAEIIVPVEIYSADKYNAELALSKYILYLSQGEQFEPKDYLLSLSYYGTVIGLGGTLPDGVTLKTNDQVNVNEPGVYTVSYTVSYTVRETEYTGYAKLVVIIEE